MSLLSTTLPSTMLPSATPRFGRAARRTALTALGGAALLAASLVALPGAAAPAAATGDPCVVESADLHWGFKESFRSYISGAIANGEWTTSDGAGYETPEFFWENGAGTVSSALDGGTIEYTGSINFTGHDGGLSMDVRNPAIEFDGTDTAYLLLDFGATDQAEEEAVESELLRVAKVDLAGSLAAESDAFTITNAIPRLTSEGASALNGDYGSYAAGDEMDPITVSATVSGCELGTVVAAETDEPTPAETIAPIAEPQGQEIPWVPIIIGGVAVLVIGVSAGLLIAGRAGRRPGSTPGADGSSEGV